MSHILFLSLTIILSIVGCRTKQLKLRSVISPQEIEAKSLAVAQGQYPLDVSSLRINFLSLTPEKVGNAVIVEVKSADRTQFFRYHACVANSTNCKDGTFTLNKTTLYKMPVGEVVFEIWPCVEVQNAKGGAGKNCGKSKKTNYLQEQSDNLLIDELAAKLNDNKKQMLDLCTKANNLAKNVKNWDKDHPKTPCSPQTIEALAKFNQSGEHLCSLYSSSGVLDSIVNDIKQKHQTDADVWAVGLLYTGSSLVVISTITSLIGRYKIYKAHNAIEETKEELQVAQQKGATKEGIESKQKEIEQQIEKLQKELEAVKQGSAQQLATEGVTKKKPKNIKEKLTRLLKERRESGVELIQAIKKRKPDATWLESSSLGSIWSDTRTEREKSVQLDGGKEDLTAHEKYLKNGLKWKSTSSYLSYGSAAVLLASSLIAMNSKFSLADPSTTCEQYYNNTLEPIAKKLSSLGQEYRKLQDSLQQEVKKELQKPAQ